MFTDRRPTVFVKPRERIEHRSNLGFRYRWPIVADFKHDFFGVIMCVYDHGTTLFAMFQRIGNKVGKCLLHTTCIERPAKIAARIQSDRPVWVGCDKLRDDFLTHESKIDQTPVQRKWLS